MISHRFSSKRALSLAVLLLTFAMAALAQTQSGNLYGTVKSTDGASLPGVTVTLLGSAAPQVQVSDAQGQFRFPGLPPGAYTVKLELDQFTPMEYSDISVNVGRNTELDAVLPAFGDVIEIMADRPPLLDRQETGRTDTITLSDLERIPSARDPWSVLQSTPGVLTDRINVGSNESGQQSNYVGPGSGGDQAVWSLDGMVITDMSAIGSSPGYYDFDAFEEMQVTTGGSDASTATGGVVLNMVTKRGGNEWRGSGRYLISDDSLQSDLEIDRGELGQAGAWNGGNAQTAFKQGNRIVENVDLGAEIGGPVVKDRLWFWGSYAEPKIHLLTIDDVSDKTTLTSWNGKLNVQITPGNSASAFVWESDKVKTGRNASPQRPQETTWNQSGFGPSPTAYKLEDTQILGSSFFLSGMYSVVNGGFQLVPQGGEAVPFRDSGLQWHNSFFLNQIKRPQEQIKGDASNFFNTGRLSHELKYGAGYRTAEQSSLFRWPGGGLEQILGNGNDLLILTRDAVPSVKTDYTNVYAQDTLAVGNLTANVGVRYDRQGGKNLASTAPANSVFPEILPAVTYGGGDAGFTWSSITPRLGLTYALGAEKKTLLRASFSRFADQLGTGTASFLNPLAGVGYHYFYTSNNGDPTIEPGDLEVDAGVGGNVHPITLGYLQSNAVDPNLEAPITDELLLGVEHALLPELVIGLNVNYRKSTGILETERLVFDSDRPFGAENLDSVGRVHRRDDYVERTSTPSVGPDGRTYTVHYWELREGVSTRNGFRLENGDREQEFRGASLTFNKRLANRWMMRGNVSWQDWTWQIPDSENEDPTDTIAGGIVDGTGVLQGSGLASGAKGNVFINGKWSYSLNGMYQIAPAKAWGVNLAASLTGRQGYPLRYVRRIGRQTISDNGGSGLDIPVDASVDAFRYPDVHVVDLRAEKEFVFNPFGLTLGIDLFNAFNESYVLQRQGVLQRSTSDHVVEILSPRVLRLGARFSFR
ncbi:MAG TPA: TonB-dependent receptor [Thermoanaerobaculia bacterium]|nr:TonB-dependent receptor [Thermoanaerobaculia bacterium]